MVKNIKFANIIFSGLQKEDVLSESDSMKLVATVNAEFIVTANNNKRFLKILNESCTTFDGQVPYLIAKVKNKKKKFKKISGSDLIYDFCDFASHKNKKIFLLGGYEDSNKNAVNKLKKKYNIQISGYSPKFMPYPFDNEHNKIIIEKISQFNPDILFVAFGAVKQELWIDDNRQLLNNIGIKWAIGCGGTYELVSGEVTRSPKIMQIIGLESIWRLINEPKMFRLKRVIKSMLVFKYIFY